MKINVTCGWCGEDFETDNQKGKSGEYPVRVCSRCGRVVAASKIEPTGNSIGRKHIHSDSKNGDVV